MHKDKINFLKNVYKNSRNFFPPYSMNSYFYKKIEKIS